MTHPGEVRNLCYQPPSGFTTGPDRCSDRAKLDQAPALAKAKTDTKYCAIIPTCEKTNQPSIMGTNLGHKRFAYFNIWMWRSSKFLL